MRPISAALMAAFLFASPAIGEEPTCTPTASFQAVWTAVGGQVGPTEEATDEIKVRVLERGIFAPRFDAISPAIDAAGNTWAVLTNGECFVVAFVIAKAARA